MEIKKKKQRRVKLTFAEELEALRLFEFESFDAMVRYVHSKLSSYIMAKTCVMDLIYDFKPTIDQIKRDRELARFGHNRRSENAETGTYKH